MSRPRTGSAVTAERIIPALAPDVMILDVRLPDGSGIEVCRRIPRETPRSRPSF